ncbi:Portal protein, phage associated [Dehalobacter sp. UNSWDHB]|uniref:phage portal protein n=1 Tax=Dehalobacter sp. UNSWDHB TaxID=1339256 RepID=UPI0003876828|nr:phage portal protein [Dehalobacter sp. UNSWDHB]EQB20029.1 Portal protein, phage associated [Dehalobacter sp. UNSWDHB]
MGVFETIFRRPKSNITPEGYFKMLNGYTPVFTSAPESIYEMELTRAAIHSFANMCSKLKPEISGSAYKNLEKILQFRPNPFMDTAKFLYRIATILSVNNTAFIVPIEDDMGYIMGYYPLLPQKCEVVQYEGRAYLRYTFGSGQKAAIEFERVGVVTNYQYADDVFGSSNAALNPTMQLITTQNQGIINGVKNSASIRFLAKIANMIKPEDITKERQRFTEDNLSSENNSGMIIYDAKFADIKQIDSKPFTVNALQMQQINENVFTYFGTNTKILQNSFTEDEWNAYYEGKIEPFAIRLSLVMSNMTYTPREIAHGNAITFTANRLQYASNQTKLSISTQLFDRGLLNRNGVMDIWNMAHVEGGDKYYIRKEYSEVNQLGKEVTPNANSEGSGISGNDPAVVVDNDGGGEED